MIAHHVPAQQTPWPLAYPRTVRFMVLGSVQVEGDGQLETPGGLKQRTVLAVLIAHAGSTVSTERLIEATWGEEPPNGARRSLQTYISNLRGDLGDVVSRDGPGYTLAADRAQVDALWFEDEVTAAADLADDPAASAERLRRALGVWRGHPYADVDGGTALSAEITRLNELRVAAIEERVDADLEVGAHRDLIAELDSLTAEYPLRERFRAQQMLALYRSGRQAEALRAYERTRSYLVEEMGLDPSLELRELEQRILEQDPSLGAPGRPAIKRVAVLVADVDDPRALAELAPSDRSEFITAQSETITTTVALHDGTVFAHRGSAVYVSFPDAHQAVASAAEVLRALGSEHPQALKLRMAIAVGEVESTNGEVTGPPISRAAGLVGAAHGGQVLLSSEAHSAVTDAGANWLIRGMGSHDIEGLGRDQVVHQLVIDGLATEFTGLRSHELPPALPAYPTGVPGYELREQVGAGAFGVVHRAYQPSVGRQVAVKIIRPEFANNAEFIRRFEVEAQLVARLEYPYIVPLYDYWRTPDGAFLVMRWLGGLTLESRLESGPLSVPETSALLSQIGPALAYAHRHGVVHRDLKTSNILLDEDGNAYLSDFGVAVEGGDESDDLVALGGLIATCLPHADGVIVDVVSGAISGDHTNVASFLEAWETAVGGGDVGVDVVRFTPTRNPYKGLHAFGESDAVDFYGRTEEIAQLVEVVSEERLVAVVGPSGIGKSSVVRAGLIPTLRAGALPGSDRWLITDLIPGPYPYEELTSALMKVASARPADLESELRRDERGLVTAARRYLPEGAELFVLIDQFEELFTLVSDESERLAFLNLLRAVVLDGRSSIRVVVTMRADYFDRPLRFGDFGELLRESTVPLAAPTDDGLHEIIELPAGGIGVQFESGLVDRIASDVMDQSGALPLLEFSLTELFDARETDLLSVDSYQSAGGVLGALGRRAEETYQELHEAEQVAARQVYLRLVAVSDSGRDTKRRVRLSDLRRLDLDETGVLDAFGSHRLLTFDRDSVTRGPSVEVAHEAILTEWPRLAGWIDEQREDLVLQGRLAAAMEDWEGSGRAEGYLLTGGRLTQHETWTVGTDLSPTSAEREFLAASRTAEDQRLAKRRRARRRMLAGFGVAAVIGLLLAVAALVARNDAADQADLAEASRLATASINVLGDDPELSLLLALASASEGAAPSFEQRRALHAAIDRDKAAGVVEHRYLTAWTSRGWVSPDGSLLMVSGEHRAPLSMYRVSDEGHEFLWTAEEIPPELMVRAAFIKEGGNVLVWALWPGGYDQSVAELEDWSVEGLYVFDAVTGDLVTRHASPGCDARYSFDYSHSPRTATRNGSTPAGDVIAGWCLPPGEFLFAEGTATFENTWWLQDPESGEILHSETNDKGVWYVSPTADGSLVQIDHAGGTEIRDMESGAVSPITLDLDYAPWAMLSPSGQFLLHGARLLNPDTGTIVTTLEGDRVGLEGCDIGKVFSEDESRLMVGCEDATLRLFDTDSGDEIGRLQGHSGWVIAGSFASTGQRFASGSADGTVRMWDLGVAGEIGHIDLGPGYYADAGIDVVDQTGVAIVYPSETETLFDGLRSFVTRPAVGELVIFDVQRSEVVHRFPDIGGKVARVSPDGSMVVAQTASLEGLGELGVFDVETGQMKFQFGGLCRWIPGTDSSGCGDLIAAEVIDLTWSADGRYVAIAGGRSQRAMVWDVSSQELVFASEPAGIEPFSAIAFSADGTLLAASSKTGMWVYDTASWDLVRPLIPHTGRPSWVMRFSSDGSELITAQAHSGDIRIYDTENWEERNMRGGDAQTRDMAISHDETLAALADKEGNIHVLALETGEVLELISLDDRDITNIAFLAGDHHLLISGANGPVEIITLDAEELLQIARSRISRSFTDVECKQFDLDPCPTLDELQASA